MRRRTFMAGAALALVGCGRADVVPSKPSAARIAVGDCIRVLMALETNWTTADEAGMRRLLAPGYVVTDATHDHTLDADGFVRNMRGRLGFQVQDMNEQGDSVEALSQLEIFDQEVERRVRVEFVTLGNQGLVSRLHGLPLSA